MPRETHKDFYNRLEQPALAALHTAALDSAKRVALVKYRRAVNATFRATDRRWKFLAKYQP